MVLALEDSQHVASRYASQLLLEKKLTTPAQTMREIDKVTAEDVQQVAADLFRSSRLNLALIGPYKNEEEFRKLLSL
jgi:predicted Zn-dependent peptidase